MELISESGFFGLFFFAAVFLAIGIVMAFQPDHMRRRMKEAIAATSDQAAASVRYRYGDGGFLDLLGRLEKFAAKGEKEQSSVRMSLVRAGFYDPKAVTYYFGARVFAALVLAVAVLIGLPILNTNESIIPIGFLPVFAGLAGSIGYLGPALYLSRRTQSRQLSVREGFPDALDMMLVCVEAGLGLAAAIERVGTELARANGVLAENLKLVGMETRAGKTRQEALRSLAARTGVDDVGSFVTMLIQTEQLGTSLAETLRVYAFEMRNRRMLRAEEQANKLPVKIVLPLAFCILPCLWIVIFTPLVIKIVRGFANV
jgi:tight adherence protein C